LKRIGLVKDFYKLRELNLQDLKLFYKLGIERAIPHLQKVNRGWVESFELIFKLRNMVDGLGIDDLEINELLETATYNFEENLHSGIEGNAIKYINSILIEDISFYQTEQGCIDFSHFISVQNMRTEGAKSSVVEALSIFDFIDMDKIWNVLSHIYASNKSWHLYAHRRTFRMVLLKNESPEEFITSDQPVINTYGVGLGIYEPPEELEFFYPVSPHLAILITGKKNDWKNKKSLSQYEVTKYNKMIAHESHTQIFAKSREWVVKYSDKNNRKRRALYP
jgi:hypothetical protein